MNFRGPGGGARQEGIDPALATNPRVGRGFRGPTRAHLRSPVSGIAVHKGQEHGVRPDHRPGAPQVIPVERKRHAIVAQRSFR